MTRPGIEPNTGLFNLFVFFFIAINKSTLFTQPIVKFSENKVKINK